MESGQSERAEMESATIAEISATESISGTCSLLIFRYLTKVALKSSWVIANIGNKQERVLKLTEEVL